MKRSIDESEIKVVIMNPECIPAAQERLIKALYEDYIREYKEKDDEIA